MNYGKKSVSKKAKFADFPYCHDGQKSSCVADQSSFCGVDHDLRGDWLYRNWSFSGNYR